MSTPTPPLPGAEPVSFGTPEAKFYPKILLIGPAFNGKTTILCHFPQLDLVDTDNKVANALKVVQPKGWVRRPLINSNGTPVEETITGTEAFARIDNAVTAAVTNPEALTVGLDSISRVDFHLRRHIALITATSINPVTVGGMKFMSQAHWNPYEVLMTRLLGKLLATPKIAIVTAHVSIEKDEVVGGVWQTLALPGRSQGNVPTMFTDCWLVTGGEDKGRWVTKVRTAPGGFPRCNHLGTSLELPVEFEFSWTLVEAALKKRGVL